MSNKSMSEDTMVPDGPLVASPMLIRTAQRALPAYRAWALAGVLLLAGITSGCGGADAKTDKAADDEVTSASSDDAVQATTVAPDTESDTPAAVSGSACGLLSEGDVTAAMRQPMEVSGDAGAICSYAAAADPSVLLYLQTFANQAEAATDTQLEPSSEHIDGLGDDAFWNSTLDMVFVRVGDRAFSVTSPSLANLAGDPHASNPVMVGLAKIALQTF
jgi:hypothetical protein